VSGLAVTQQPLRGTVVSNPSNPATRRATGEDPNPCRGTADTSPFLAGPVFRP